MSVSGDSNGVSPAPRRFRQELLLYPFILGASLVSLYSTYQGFSQVLSGGYANQTIAIGMSIFLVLVASFCSYQLGEMLANAALGRKSDGRFGRLLLVPFLVAFALTASASGLFSYTFWHEQFYKISALQFDAGELPRDLAFRVVMPDLNAEIVKHFENTAKAIRASSDLKSWEDDNPRKLLQIAGERGAGFEAALQTALDKTRDEAQKRRNHIDDLNGDSAKIGAEIDNLRTQLNGVTNALARPEARAAQEELDAQRKVVEDEKQLVESSINGLDKSGRPGCVTICQAHKAAQKAAEDKIAARLRQLKPLTDQRDRLQREIAARTKVLADKINDIVSINAQGSGANPSAESAAAPIARLKTALDDFENDPRDETLIALTSACEPVLQIAKVSFSNDSAIASSTCAYPGGGATRLLSERQAQDEAWRSWKSDCDTSGGTAQDHGLTASIAAIAQRAKSADIRPSSLLEEARRLVSQCVERSGAMGIAAIDQSNLESRISDFVRANSLDRNEFERSMSDLRALTPSAAFGMLFAAFMELSILAFKMLTDIVAARMQRRPASVNGPVGDVSDNPGDRYDLRVYKALYRHLRPAGGDADEIKEADIESNDVAPELRGGLRAQIAKFAREGRASRKGDGYLVSHAAIFAEVEPALVGAASAGPSRPRPVDEVTRRPEPTSASQVAELRPEPLASKPLASNPLASNPVASEPETSLADRLRKRRRDG